MNQIDPTGREKLQAPRYQPLLPTTSVLATVAILFATVGTLCLGPAGPILAVVFGVLALSEIGSSGGRLLGRGMAITSIISGAAVSAIWVAAVVIFAVASSRGNIKWDDPATYIPALPALPRTNALPRQPFVAPPPREPTMSPITATTEASIGKITVVDIGTDVGALAAALGEQRSKAKSAAQLFVLQTTQATCRPCLGVAAALPDQRMQRALGAVRLVRASVSEFGPELEKLGISTERIPGFYLLDDKLRPSDGIDGGEWDDDTVENIAPVLGAFVHGKYQRRRTPFRPSFPRQSDTVPS